MRRVVEAVDWCVADRTARGDRDIVDGWAIERRIDRSLNQTSSSLNGHRVPDTLLPTAT